VLSHADKKSRGVRASQKAGAHNGLSAVLYEDAAMSRAVAGGLPNSEAWKHGRVLQVGDSHFSIVYNPPTAEKVSWRTSCLASGVCVNRRRVLGNLDHF
jgi:hypothetical protein